MTEHPGAAFGATSLGGELRFYDEGTAWGVIAADDGRLYVMRGRRAARSPLRVGVRVVFEPLVTPGGLCATAVRRGA
jgi:hypothetical protein